MKKSLGFCALALLLGISSNALAQQNIGGFTGPSNIQPTSVADAVQKADDSYVELTGNIEKSLGDEKYTFKDESGSVTVEIDNEDFGGVSVDEKDTIKIKGEVDKEILEETTIDVNSIEKVQ